MSDRKGLQGELGNKIREIARKHLGEPWNANVSLNDDGSYTVEIIQILGDEFTPKNPPKETESEFLIWKKKILWESKSNKAQKIIIYKEGSKSKERHHKTLCTIDVSGVAGVIDNVKTRNTIIETSEDAKVDYMRDKSREVSFINPGVDPKDSKSVSQKSDTSEGFPTDEVSERFSKAYRVWNQYLSNILIEDYENRPPRTYDLNERRYKVEDRIPEISRLMDNFNRLHPFGSQTFKTHKHKILKLKTFYQELKRNIRTVGEEFAEKWNDFTTSMDIMIRVLKEKNDGFM